jgi:putative transposase
MNLGLPADDSVSAVRAGGARYLAFYNVRRPNTALGDHKPDEALLHSRYFEKTQLE